RQRRDMHAKRVLAPEQDWVAQSGEERRRVVMVPGRFPVHRAPRARKPASERQRDRLLAEAYAEQRHIDLSAGEGEREREVDRRARTGREHQRERTRRLDLGDARAVVADDRGARAGGGGRLSGGGGGKGPVVDDQTAAVAAG